MQKDQKLWKKKVAKSRKLMKKSHKKWKTNVKKTQTFEEKQ